MHTKLAHWDRNYFGANFSSRRWRGWFVVDRETGSDLLTPSRPHFDPDPHRRPSLASAVLRILDRLRARLGLSRLALCLLLLLSFFGLRDAWHNHVYKGQHSAEQDLVPWTSTQRKAFLQNFYFQQDDFLPRVSQPLEPDVSVILLNWKRLDNLNELVKHACSLSFVHTVLVWNASRFPFFCDSQSGGQHL